MSDDGSGAKGTVTLELAGPDGQVKERRTVHNLITAIGDRRYAESGAGLAAPAVPTGMKLGTGTAAPTKTGAGAALAAYLANSHLAFDAAPTSADNGTGLRRIRYVCTYAAGKATTSGTAIGEAVIVNESPLADATNGEAATISRVLISPGIHKGSGDTLTITWDHTIGTLPA